MVDANVVRILARLRRLAGDPKLAVKQHAVLADALLDPDRPGDFNQVSTIALYCSRYILVNQLSRQAYGRCKHVLQGFPVSWLRG